MPSTTSRLAARVTTDVPRARNGARARLNDIRNRKRPPARHAADRAQRTSLPCLRLQNSGPSSPSSMVSTPPSRRLARGGRGSNRCRRRRRTRSLTGRVRVGASGHVAGGTEAKLASGLLVLFAISDASERAGCLPYRTVPVERVLTDRGPRGREVIADRVDAYYRAHDMDIVRDIDSAMATYDVDAEAKATLAESMKAHEYGLYRSCCRVLLPEIERVLREDWIGIGGIKTLKLGAITDKVNQYHLEDFILDEGGLVLFAQDLHSSLRVVPGSR